MVIQQCECISCHQDVHLKAVTMIHFTCIFYHDQRKKAYIGVYAQNAQFYFHLIYLCFCEAHILSKSLLQKNQRCWKWRPAQENFNVSDYFFTSLSHFCYHVKLGNPYVIICNNNIPTIITTICTSLMQLQCVKGYT